VTRSAHRVTLSLCLCLLAGSAAADAERILLSQRDLPRGWEVVREAPGDPSGDADLRAWGVREQQARHYTRDRHGTIQVCSVEIWVFDSVAQAGAAESGFHYPDWQISRAGALLVLVRGLVRAPRQRPRRGVFPTCEDFGAQIRARAAAS